MLRPARPAWRLLAAAGLAALAGLAGCGRRGTPKAPHEGVACVGCHRSGVTVAGRAGVPDAACAARGCHPNGGPDSARIAMVTFKHSAHPMSEQRTVPCAGCHTHAPGSTVLQADSSTCALCHYPQIAGTRDAGCELCHVHPSHTSLTSQGVPLQHGRLAQAKVPCTRCHYRLVEGDTTVAVGRCAACHSAKPPAKLPPADSAHAAHPDMSCRTCHSRVRHRVVAMSGSITLQCLDCHASRHRPPLPVDSSLTALAAGSSETQRCGECHAGVHAEEQRLLLGLMPGEQLRPSLMFIGGVTCRSCHVTPDAPRPAPGTSLKPNAHACVGCHGPDWSGMLGRWNRGYDRRRDWITGYLTGAETAVQAHGAPPAALADLAEARGLLAFVQRAGPVHNLTAADQIMRRALGLGEAAYRLAQLSPPPPPALGPPVRGGSCLSCHYGIEEAPAGRDSSTGRMTTHAPHILGAGLTCDACHAVGAAPPGVPDSLWITTGSPAASGKAEAP